MSPDDIRKQAATMKAMGPAALRAMNPQMATLSGKFRWMVVHTKLLLPIGRIIDNGHHCSNLFRLFTIQYQIQKKMNKSTWPFHRWRQ